jgi:hypothetical protein
MNSLIQHHSLLFRHSFVFLVSTVPAGLDSLLLTRSSVSILIVFKHITHSLPPQSTITNQKI